MNIVRELRKSAGMQQKELAAIVGVSVATVSDWETQKKNPSGDRLKKLAETFGVNPLVVLGAMEPPDPTTAVPRTLEARIVSGGMDKLPLEDREKILNVVRAMFAQHPELFEDERKENDDDSKL